MTYFKVVLSDVESLVEYARSTGSVLLRISGAGSKDFIVEWLRLLPEIFK